MKERITITLGDLGDITATKDTFNELAIVFMKHRANITQSNALR